MKSPTTTTAPPVVDPIRVLVELEAQIAALVLSLDVEFLGHHQADQVHKKLTVGVRQLEALKARVGARMAATEPKTGSGGQTTQEKVKARSGTSAKKAADELAVGASLGTNKALGVAAGSGDISVEHAALIAAAADGDPVITDALIKIAVSGDLAALKHACLRHKACRGNPQQKQATERRNRFGSWKIGDDGIAQLLARGHVGDFVELFKILDAETEAVFRTARQHGARESQGAYRHDAVRNLLEGRPTGTYGPDASGTTYHPKWNAPSGDHPAEKAPTGSHPSDTEPPTSGTEPSTSVTERPTSGTKPPTSGTKPPTSGTEPWTSEDDESFSSQEDHSSVLFTLSLFADEPAAHQPDETSSTGRSAERGEPTGSSYIPDSSASPTQHARGAADKAAATEPDAGCSTHPTTTTPAAATNESADAGARPGPDGVPVCVGCGGPVVQSPIPPNPPKAKKRDELSVMIDLGAMRRGYPTGDETCEIPGIGVVPVEVAHRIADDALISLVLKDGKDLKLLHRFPRGIPIHLRQAFGIRDKHCSVPSCSNTLRLEVDHTMIDYADDGPLALWSSNRLCQKHHHHKTRKHYQLAGPPGLRGWYGPDGQLIVADPGHDPVRHNPNAWTPRHALAHHLGIAETELSEAIVAAHHGWTVHQLQHHPLARHLHLRTCECKALQEE